MKYNALLVLLFLVLGNAAYGAAHGTGEKHTSPLFQDTSDFSLIALTPQQSQDDSPEIASDIHHPELPPGQAARLAPYRDSGAGDFNGKCLCIRGPPPAISCRSF